tara:strand:- start:197 stop:502 length:306 start_codon:yes stop_codon:yes gene_type:complete
MLNNKKILILFVSILFLNSCGGDVGKVLRNEKIKNTDEFLVKKREPLILPPDYDKIPSPGSLRKTEERNEVENILKIPEESSNKINNESSVEQSIIDKIKK